jgi:hypothetical protein
MGPALPMAIPVRKCELAHIAGSPLRATVRVGNEPKGTRVGNESVGGNDCSTLCVEYRPSSRYLQQSP